ncbi:MAG: hypothetical protein ACOYOQ_00095 [Microthrixaceae bacterium]
MPKRVDGTYEPPRLKGRIAERTYRCPECWDRRWVVTEDEDQPPTAKPCRHCAPVEYARWRDGHHDPDHTCEECAAVRSGRASAYDYDGDGRYLGA